MYVARDSDHIHSSLANYQTLFQRFDAWHPLVLSSRDDTYYTQYVSALVHIIIFQHEKVPQETNE